MMEYWNVGFLKHPIGNYHDLWRKSKNNPKNLNPNSEVLHF
jgi:hypothetical protein